MEQITIYYYDAPSDLVKEQNIYLNSYADSPFEIDGVKYQTVEHYYQSMKFKGYMEDVYKEIMALGTPDKAKKLARKHEDADKPVNPEHWVEWLTRKDDVMRTAFKAKFDLNPDLKEKLMATGDAKLVEASEIDMYWGGIKEGSKNMHGILLMELRESYK